MLSRQCDWAQCLFAFHLSISPTSGRQLIKSRQCAPLFGEELLGKRRGRDYLQFFVLIKPKWTSLCKKRTSAKKKMLEGRRPCLCRCEQEEHDLQLVANQSSSFSEKSSLPALSLSLSFSFLYRLRLTVSLLAQMSNRLHSIKLEDAKRPKWQTKRGVKDEEEEAAARACKRECDASLH